MVLVIATAGLVYELSMAAVASYLLGDSVRQFSLIIGIYLSALGLGAYLSKYVAQRVAWVFVDVELGAAIIGGLSAPGLFLAFAYTDSFAVLLYAAVVAVGTLVGLELPLLIRVLERHVTFKDLIAKALTFDYAGALLGSLGFSLLLVPQVGLVRSSVVCGALNAAVALASTWVLPRLAADGAESGGPESSTPDFRAARLRASLVLLGLLALLPFTDRVLQIGEETMFPGKVVYSEQSPYQRVVVTQRKAGFELFLNGNLQFASRDEARYHEALVHPAFLVNETAQRVLIGGGGDGLAAREVLKWPDVTRLVLVDLDPAMTNLGREFEPLRELNRGSLHDPRVQIVNQDAMAFLRKAGEQFDIVLLDFPDPSNYSLGKLYSERFYSLVRQHLAPGGAIVVQASSPLLARQTFWCNVTTLEAVGLHTWPYHALVPSFGEWGFVLAAHEPFEAAAHPPLQPASRRGIELSYLNDQVLDQMFRFSADTSRLDVPSNRLNTQALVHFYLDEWSRVN